VPGEYFSVMQAVKELVEPLENDRSVHGHRIKLVLEAPDQRADGVVVNGAQVDGGTLADVHADVVHGRDQAAKSVTQHGTQRGALECTREKCESPLTKLHSVVKYGFRSLTLRTAWLSMKRKSSVTFSVAEKRMRQSSLKEGVEPKVVKRIYD
jgi:hypothetical protein